MLSYAVKINGLYLASYSEGDKIYYTPSYKNAKWFKHPLENSVPTDSLWGTEPEYEKSNKMYLLMDQPQYDKESYIIWEPKNPMDFQTVEVHLKGQEPFNCRARRIHKRGFEVLKEGEHLFFYSLTQDKIQNKV
jgi:hypothetical protein